MALNFELIVSDQLFSVVLASCKWFKISAPGVGIRHMWQLDEARAEFCQIFCSFLGQWSFKKNWFWDSLTFRPYLENISFFIHNLSFEGNLWYLISFIIVTYRTKMIFQMYYVLRPNVIIIYRFCFWVKPVVSLISKSIYLLTHNIFFASIFELHIF